MYWTCEKEKPIYKVTTQLNCFLLETCLIENNVESVRDKKQTEKHRKQAKEGYLLFREGSVKQSSSTACGRRKRVTKAAFSFKSYSITLVPIETDGK